jgi:hypothetical protein
MNSTKCADSGRLFLGSYFPGEWSTRTGGISVGTDAYRGMEGSLHVVVIRWAADPLQSLKQLMTEGHVGSLLASEADRLEHGVKPPDGWEYLWFLGPSKMYSTGEVAPSKRPSIACYAHRDAAIPTQGCVGPTDCGHPLALVLESGCLAMRQA